MGMFDSVWGKCPNCGNDVEFQSKVGECALHDYNVHDAPPAILGDLDGEIQTCTICGTNVRLSVCISAVINKA